MSIDALIWIALAAAAIWAINTAWRWLTRPRRIVTRARLYRWPGSNRRSER